MKSILIVPIHVDALHLVASHAVSPATADYSHLPYTSGGRDYNAFVPYLSEEIFREPFHAPDLALPAGIHLHWALPDAMTHGMHTEAGTEFPTVPNRWLISRRYDDEIDQQWVVESDYLYPEGSRPDASVTIPVLSTAAAKGQPFRHVGRVVPLEAWSPSDAEADYLDHLTAIGHGDPTFASFYPNCYSIFGFHDDVQAGIDRELLSGLCYDVVGWYSDPRDDFFAREIDPIAIGRRLARQTGQDLTEEQRNYAALRDVKERFKWAVGGTGEVFPQEMMCYGRIEFAPATDESRAMAEPPTITLGNTGAEALAAHVAQMLDTGSARVLEEQIEAVLLSSQLQDRYLDLGAKFHEAWHERGFAGRPGGWLWAVTPEVSRGSSADGEQTPALPAGIAHTLNELNRRQRTYDRAQAEIAGRRRQLYADWYKYLRCAYPPADAADEEYPDVDLVRDTIRRQDLAPLAEQITQTGILLLRHENDAATGPVAGARVEMDSASESIDHAPAPTDTLAGKVAAVLNAILLEIRGHNAKHPHGTQWALKRAPAPSYAQPRDPVVLLTGDAAQPTARHGQDGRLREDGLLDCYVVPDATVEEFVATRFAGLLASIDAVVEPPSIALNTWRGQPWNPLLLEWEVEYAPVEAKSNLNPSDWQYQPEFATANFDLPENASDLRPRDGTGLTRDVSVYSGSALLSPHAAMLLQQRLRDYLQIQLRRRLRDYARDAQNPNLVDEDSDLPTLWNWYQQTYLPWWAEHLSDEQIPPNWPDPLETAYRALDAAAGVHGLSQALGGFNNALRMYHQAPQLPVADPLGFSADQEFAGEVRRAMGRTPQYAPLPLNDFNPIRAGGLRLVRLQLVDTFGQVRAVACETVQAAAPLAPIAEAYHAWLPPRLAQPARLEFYWLAARGDAVEMNTHPATTPICGWLLPNNLDRSLMVYDAGGRAQGSISFAVDIKERDPWLPVPGGTASPMPDQIVNPHLRRVVQHILQLLHDDEVFHSTFLETLDTALANINPENAAQHQDLALLMGRPLAVVRASLALRLWGLAAVNQGWIAFRQDMHTGNRRHDGFPRVRFPVRLGEYHQLNDGLAGYWIEGGAGGLGDTFYAPQSEPAAGDGSIHHAHDANNITLSVEDAPLTLTMLVDPRGAVHATSGLLPTNVLQIPAPQYVPALEAIDVTFFSAPILTKQDEIAIPLPAEPGYRWSWLEKRGETWREQRDIAPASPEAHSVGRQVAREGWLHLSRTTNADEAAMELEDDE